ncbi:MAG: ion transporter, partial [Bacteroidales bacterium]|nr:ion transporter [Bacteroidales bacterium]
MTKKNWERKLGNIIFESNTKTGKVFDVVLLMVIMMSVTLVVLESIPEINEKYGFGLRIAEWAITLIFTTEYILRIIVARNRSKYLFSFYGVIDLLAVIPTYLSVFLGGIQGLMVIRALRLLRVFTILKLTRYTRESKIIMVALMRSRYKISVFLFALLMIITIIGTLMYLIEGEKHGFTSIPVGIYWAIVTLTTVGYGDITPITDIGKFISAIVMILGYAIIVVPTGIFSAQIIQAARKHQD